MNKLNYKNIITVSFLVIISICLLITTWHYFQYRDTLNQKNGEIKVEERTDFAEFRKKDVVQLKEFGFTSNEINAIHNIDPDNLSLREILHALNIELDENYIDQLSYVNKEELRKGDQYVNIIIEPVEAIYVPQEETTYLKFHYTANIQKPMFRQGKDRFIFRNNGWIYLFGYSKLHYISKNGEKRFQCIGTNFFSDITIDFKLRNNWEDETFYLKGISGLMIAKKDGYTDISTYSEYDHLKLFNYKRLTQYWSDFIIRDYKN